MQEARLIVRKIVRRVAGPGRPVNTDGAVKPLIEIRGIKSITKLAARISDIPGVISVQAGDTAAD